MLSAGVSQASCAGFFAALAGLSAKLAMSDLDWRRLDEKTADSNPSLWVFDLLPWIAYHFLSLILLLSTRLFGWWEAGWYVRLSLSIPWCSLAQPKAFSTVRQQSSRLLLHLQSILPRQYVHGLQKIRGFTCRCFFFFSFTGSGWGTVAGRTHWLSWCGWTGFDSDRGDCHGQGKKQKAIKLWKQLDIVNRSFVCHVRINARCSCTWNFYTAFNNMLATTFWAFRPGVFSLLLHPAWTVEWVSCRPARGSPDTWRHTDPDTQILL